MAWCQGFSANIHTASVIQLCNILTEAVQCGSPTSASVCLGGVDCMVQLEVELDLRVRNKPRKDAGPPHPVPPSGYVQCSSKDWSLPYHRSCTWYMQCDSTKTGACLITGHAQDAVAVVHELGWVAVYRAPCCLQASWRLLRAALVAMIRGAIACT